MGAVVSRPPLVGVSTSEVRRASDHSVVPQGEPSRRELALGERYLDAVRSAGGLPVILTPVHRSAIDPLLERLDAVCLSGSPDLHPSAYGRGAQQARSDGARARPLRAGARARAVRRGMPVLGICRGAQVLNVALGGTPLHQHLPELSDVEHRQEVAGRQTTHDVKLAPDSRLAKLMGRTELGVNSFHHQAPAALGPGLRVVGKAEDGTVEAIESDAKGFVFGVQWHAECLVEMPEHFALFEGSSGGRRTSASELRAARGRAMSSLPDWAQWRPITSARPGPWGSRRRSCSSTPGRWALAHRLDDLLPVLQPGPDGEGERRDALVHARARGRVHTGVRTAVRELLTLRARLAAELAPRGLRAAVAGTHPFAVGEDTEVSEARATRSSTRRCASSHAEPAFALHVHVGVPDPELAMQAADRIGAHLPLILAVSANSPYWRGRDSGMASFRTPLFQGFPRSGMPRHFGGYAAYHGGCRPHAARRRRSPSPRSSGGTCACSPASARSRSASPTRRRPSRRRRASRR